MKPRSVFLSLSLGLASSISAAVTADTPIDQIYNYEDGSGAWVIWAYSKYQNSTTAHYQNLSSSVVSDSSNGTPNNHSYQFDVTLVSSDTNNSSYIYFRIPKSIALFGSLSLNTRIKAEVISGEPSKASVRLGFSLNDFAFGINGNAPNPFGTTLDGQWKNVGGDLMPSVAQNLQGTIAKFAESRLDDIFPYTTGPVLYIFNSAKPSENLPPLRVRITVDDVTLNGNVASLDGTSYRDAAFTAAQSYVNRLIPILDQRHQDITTNKEAIDELALTNQSALQNKINTDASIAADSHTQILNSYSTRTVSNQNFITLHVPTQAQYDQDIANLNTLSGLLNIGSYVASSGQGFLYYPWESTGKTRLDEFALGMPSTPQQTIQATLALNEIEPISIALQNLYDQTITVNQISFSSITNQFGDILDSSHIDARVVKSWYVGSTSHIYVSSSDTKVRTPELLLKDDGLVCTDDTTKTNYLRINSQNAQCNGAPTSQFYQNISAITAQMPNDAIAQDAATLQPFAIGVLQARQLWLALDTRANIKPGQYSGNISLSYTREGQSSPQTLQIPISFFVQPLQLQASPFTYSIYYLGKIGSEAPRLSDPKSGQKKSQTQYLAELKNIYDHGIPYPTQYIDSVNDINNYVALRAQLGLPCDRYYLLGGPAMIGTDAQSAHTNAVALTNALVSSSNCTNPQLYMYGIDEAGNGTPEQQAAVLAAQKAAMQKIHEADAKSFVAGYVGTYNHLGSMLDTLIFAGTPTDSEISQWRNIDKDVFSYANPQVGVPDPFIYRSRYGLTLWQHNYTGAMNYAYQDGQPAWNQRLCNDTASTYCSMWNNFDNATYYDHVFAYPTTNGVVDTIQWEGFREAVDDTRYLAILQLLTENSTDTALKTEINDWLAAIKVQADLDPIATRKTMQSYFQRLNQPPVFSNVSATFSGSTVTAKAQASDPEGYLGTVEIKLDNGNWQPAGLSNNSWQLGFANISVGNHTVYYRATDYWGAVTQQQTTIDIETHGLTANYYNNANLENSPVLTRVDPTISFNWGFNSPAAGVVSDYFSVKWTGKILPPVTGTYEFCTSTDDGVRLSINDTLIIDQWIPQAETEWCETISLTQNQPVMIEMDFYDAEEEAVAKLLWSYPGQPKTIVPTSRLYAQ